MRASVATPTDILQADLLAAYRRHFEALKAETEKIADLANVFMKVDREAFEIFTDYCDSMFDIDWTATRE